MKTAVYIFISVFASILWFVGCGSDYVESNVTSNSSQTVANGTEACVQEFYRTSVIAEIRACGSCHHALGAAGASSLILPDPSNYSDMSNYTALKVYISANPQTFINKIDGTLTHGGSSFSSQSVSILQDFADFTRNVGSCVLTSVAPLVSPIPLSAVHIAPPNKIADLAAQVMLGRSATLAEISTASNESGLSSVLDAYMNQDAFYEWVKFSFNEFLFTDKYLSGANAINLLSTADYPALTWYSSETNATVQTQLRDNTNYGIAKAPLELIAHVVKNNRPFSEILTANYIMVNPYSAISYGAVSAIVNYATVADLSLPAFAKTHFEEATIPGLPHAGILTDQVFLNRYPTTNTNVNRQRASKVLYWFLNTDILALANRAISSNDQAETFTNPTLQNPNCTVCHKVMDPVTGTFKNWGNTGRFQVRSWPATSGPIGLSLNNLMDSGSANNALQWLAGQIVQDDRFSRSAVQIFYKALTAREPLTAPASSDPDYADKMQAYLFQDVIFRNLAQQFKQSGMNAKNLIKDLIKSPLFAALYTTQGATNDYFGKSIGLAQLISPEALDQKIKNLIGYSWTNSFDTSNSAGNEAGTHYLLSSANYLTLYGGIDSDSITSRPDAFNGVMASVQSRMAIEMGCYSAPREFFFPQAARKLLVSVESTDTPTSSAAIARIKNTIVHLHQYLLGEQLSVDSSTIASTYALFYNVYKDGQQSIGAGESPNLPSMCDVTRHPDSGIALAAETTPHIDGQRVQKDANYVIRAWSAVLTYLLSDYKFIYNSNTN